MGVLVDFWELCFFIMGLDVHYNCGLKYIFVWEVK